MTYVTSIEGTITTSDGATRSFTISADGVWQQWGAVTERLGDTVDVLESIARVLMEDGHLPLPEDEEDEGR